MEVVRHRRSVRKFEPGREISRETLTTIMEAGRWAPSGANAQPWDFICVDEASVRQKVCEIFLRQGERLRAHVDAFPAVNKGYLAHTAAIIVVLGDERFKVCFPQGAGDARAEYAANNENIFFCSLGAAVQNLQLAVTASGLTSAWLSGGGEDQTAEELRELLHFPTTARPWATVPIGYPMREPRSKWRRPIEQMVHWNRFDPQQYRPTGLIQHFESDVRPFALYRPHEHMGDWPDFEERAGEFRKAYTGRITNPGGDLPDGDAPTR